MISEIALYADDTKLSKEIQSDSDVIVVQDDLFILQDWSDDWLLLFHPEKCIVIRICLPWKRNIDKPEFFMRKSDGSIVKLEVSSCEKDIGVYIDEHLLFETHIVTKVNKANSVMGIIYFLGRRTVCTVVQGPRTPYIGVRPIRLESFFEETYRYD